MAGGTIAIVRDSDPIFFDIPGKSIVLKLSDDEIQKRLSQWKAPAPKITSGYMARYAQMVTSAATGAVFKIGIME
jgi:dihydroxy-acid dehydratase